MNSRDIAGFQQYSLLRNHYENDWSQIRESANQLSLNDYHAAFGIATVFIEKPDLEEHSDLLNFILASTRPVTTWSSFDPEDQLRLLQLNDLYVKSYVNPSELDKEKCQELFSLLGNKLVKRGFKLLPEKIQHIADFLPFKDKLKEGFSYIFGDSDLYEGITEETIAQLPCLLEDLSLLGQLKQLPLSKEAKILVLNRTVDLLSNEKVSRKSVTKEEILDNFLLPFGMTKEDLGSEADEVEEILLKEEKTLSQLSLTKDGFDTMNYMINSISRLGEIKGNNSLVKIGMISSEVLKITNAMATINSGFGSALTSMCGSLAPFLPYAAIIFAGLSIVSIIAGKNSSKKLGKALSAIHSGICTVSRQVQDLKEFTHKGIECVLEYISKSNDSIISHLYRAAEMIEVNIKQPIMHELQEVKQNIQRLTVMINEGHCNILLQPLKTRLFYDLQYLEDLISLKLRKVEKDLVYFYQWISEEETMSFFNGFKEIALHGHGAEITWSKQVLSRGLSSNLAYLAILATNLTKEEVKFNPAQLMNVPIWYSVVVTTLKMIQKSQLKSKLVEKILDTIQQQLQNLKLFCKFIRESPDIFSSLMKQYMENEQQINNIVLRVLSSNKNCKVVKDILKLNNSYSVGLKELLDINDVIISRIDCYCKLSDKQSPELFASEDWLESKSASFRVESSSEITVEEDVKFSLSKDDILVVINYKEDIKFGELGSSLKTIKKLHNGKVYQVHGPFTLAGSHFFALTTEQGLELYKIGDQLELITNPFHSEEYSKKKYSKQTGIKVIDCFAFKRKRRKEVVLPLDSTDYATFMKVSSGGDKRNIGRHHFMHKIGDVFEDAFAPTPEIYQTIKVVAINSEQLLIVVYKDGLQLNLYNATSKSWISFTSPFTWNNYTQPRYYETLQVISNDSQVFIASRTEEGISIINFSLETENIKYGVIPEWKDLSEDKYYKTLRIEVLNKELIVFMRTPQGIEVRKCLEKFSRFESGRTLPWNEDKDLQVRSVTINGKNFIILTAGSEVWKYNGKWFSLPSGPKFSTTTGICGRELFFLGIEDSKFLWNCYVIERKKRAYDELLKVEQNDLLPSCFSQLSLLEIELKMIEFSKEFNNKK